MLNGDGVALSNQQPRLRSRPAAPTNVENLPASKYNVAVMENILAVGAILMSVACLAALPFARRANYNLAGYFLMNGELQLKGFVFAILSANLSIGNFLIFIASW